MTALLNLEQLEESLDYNNQGMSLVREGKILQGLELLKKGCQMGQPHALASITWNYLILNDYQSAINAYKTYIDKVEIWYDSLSEIHGRDTVEFSYGNQRLNNATNYATALHLSGGSAKDVLETCAEAYKKRWPEALVLTCVAKGIDIRSISYSRAHLVELLETYQQIQSEFKIYETNVPELVVSSDNKPFHVYAQEVEKIFKEIPIYDLEPQMDKYFQYGDRNHLDKLAEIIIETGNLDKTPEIVNYFAHHGLARFMAISLVEDLVELTPSGFDRLEAAWFDLCNLFDADPDAHYESLEELMGFDDDGDE